MDCWHQPASAVARHWIETEELGIEGRQSLEGGTILEMIEKDFPKHQPQEEKGIHFRSWWGSKHTKDDMLACVQTAHKKASLAFQDKRLQFSQHLNGFFVCLCFFWL